MIDDPEYLNDEAPEAVEPDEPKRAVRKYARRTKVELPAGDLKRLRLLRAYWPLDGSGRQPIGTILEVAKDEARTLLALGIAEREDPLD